MVLNKIILNLKSKIYTNIRKNMQIPFKSDNYRIYML